MTYRIMKTKYRIFTNFEYDIKWVGSCYISCGSSGGGGGSLDLNFVRRGGGGGSSKNLMMDRI